MSGKCCLAIVAAFAAFQDVSTSVAVGLAHGFELRAVPDVQQGILADVAEELLFGGIDGAAFGGADGNASVGPHFKILEGKGANRGCILVVNRGIEDVGVVIGIRVLEQKLGQHGIRVASPEEGFRAFQVPG